MNWPSRQQLTETTIAVHQEMLHTYFAFFVVELECTGFINGFRLFFLIIIRNERKWRKWVDDTFIHTLSPNIYRTWAEAMQASNYFSDVGDFSATQRFLAKYFGAVIMYYVGIKMKKK